MAENFLQEMLEIYSPIATALQCRGKQSFESLEKIEERFLMNGDSHAEHELRQTGAPYSPALLAWLSLLKNGDSVYELSRRIL